MICITHSKYKGISKPRVGCIHCWAMWLDKHQDANILGKDMLNILGSIHEETLELHNRCGDIAELAHGHKAP